MRAPRLIRAAPGDLYLVDLGKLIPVAAVNPRAAFHIASTCAFGKDQEPGFEHPLVYQLDSDGGILAVFE